MRRAAHEISSTHAGVFASSGLRIFGLLESFFLCLLFIHACLLPFGKCLRCNGREVGSKFMTLMRLVSTAASLKGKRERTSTSRNSSRLMVLAFSASSAALRCDLSMNPGGSACRY